MQFARASACIINIACVRPNRARRINKTHIKLLMAELFSLLRAILRRSIINGENN